MDLKQNETLLKGSLVLNGSSHENDAIRKRIDWLVSNSLKEIATDETGWIKLYQDSKDNRYWELTYPESGQHGGGAPQLECLSDKMAQNKYQL